MNVSPMGRSHPNKASSMQGLTSLISCQGVLGAQCLQLGHYCSGMVSKRLSSCISACLAPVEVAADTTQALTVPAAGTVVAATHRGCMAQLHLKA
jgi:hypothetical protein